MEQLHDGSPAPALIITDFLMPGTTGWDFMKHIRDDARLRSLPVIIATGAGAGEAFTLADAVLQKPLDMDTLVKTIRVLSPPPAHRAALTDRGGVRTEMTVRSHS